MKLDNDSFLTNMNIVELDGKKILVRPSQADSTKGKRGCHTRGATAEDDQAKKSEGRPMTEE
jgi:hypothetical protein